MPFIKSPGTIIFAKSKQILTISGLRDRPEKRWIKFRQELIHAFVVGYYILRELHVCSQLYEINNKLGLIIIGVNNRRFEGGK